MAEIRPRTLGTVTGTIAARDEVEISDINATGTADATTVLYGDGRWDVPPAGGGGGSVATDAIWDAVGDLAVGSGADTAARLAKGTGLQYLRVNSGATGLEWASFDIVNANINASAAIAYGKLNLTGSIVNADVSASAAIAYSKLNLAGAITNADLAGSIALTKLATIANNTILGNNDGSAAAPQALTMSEVRTLLGSGTQDNTTYLRGDGTWATPAGGGSVATDAIFDAKGDLPVGTGSDTADNLTAGANDTMLMADSGQTTGLKWATPATVRTALGLGSLATASAVGTGEITDGSILNTDLTNMLQNRVKGRASSGSGAPEDLTPAQVRTIAEIDSLYSSVTLVTTPSSTAAETLWTYSMPANTLTNAGDSIEIECWGDYQGGTAANWNFTFNVGTTAYAPTAVASGTTTNRRFWNFKVTVSRRLSSTADVGGLFVMSASAASGTALAQDATRTWPIYGAAGESFASSMTISLTSTFTAANANNNTRLRYVKIRKSPA